jgi:hypothetical protein
MSAKTLTVKRLSLCLAKKIGQFMSVVDSVETYRLVALSETLGTPITVPPGLVGNSP